VWIAGKGISVPTILWNLVSDQLHVPDRPRCWWLVSNDAEKTCTQCDAPATHISQQAKMKYDAYRSKMKHSSSRSDPGDHLDAVWCEAHSKSLALCPLRSPEEVPRHMRAANRSSNRTDESLDAARMRAMAVSVE